ncbi:caspase family protein [Nibrella viscosa]|uniref:caspase family protein n=1 Tax=Nibrella viscosa TaxID=1084524 RepID=UPI0031E855DF
MLFITVCPAPAQKSIKIVANGQAPAGTERRLALVVGNTRYNRPGAMLANPGNDADAMAAMLDKLGFEVIKRKDLDRVGFEQAIDNFGKRLANYDVGLFYFSGHGLQYEGETYLVPTDENMAAPAQIGYHCVNLGRLLSAMEGSEAQTNIVMLDACRSNPFPKAKKGPLTDGGLAIPRNPPGTIVVYATSANSTADDNPGETNGLFTGQLLRYIGQPNRTLSQILIDTRRSVYDRSNKRQLPADYSQLLGDFVFVEQRKDAEKSQEANEIAEGVQAFENKEYSRAFSLLSRHSHLLDAASQARLGAMYYNGEGVAVDYIKAEIWFRKAAEQGNARAKNGLGNLYWFGRGGLTKDPIEALRWFKESANQGDPRGQYSLGVMYENGYGVARDYGQAVSWYRKAAEQGHAPGQTNLGYMYRNGYGVTQDYSQAVSWYRKAAEQGDAPGQTNLGYMYRNGYGVTQDYSQAVSWYRKAAEQGHAPGQTNLGNMYRDGKGVTQDYGQAVSWYRKAAEQGYVRGQVNLGYMYENGYGVTQDYSQAVSWYRKAAEQGDAPGQTNLGYMYENGYGVTQDYSQAVSWYRKAAEQGDAQGQTNLGYMYGKGYGVTQDYSQAVSWYRKAAEQGNVRGQVNLGNMYENGYGVTQDYSQAVSWYRKASEQGDAGGQAYLGDMYEYGKGVTKNLVTAIEWYTKAARQSNDYAQKALRRLGKSW